MNPVSGEATLPSGMRIRVWSDEAPHTGEGPFYIGNRFQILRKFERRQHERDWEGAERRAFATMNLLVGYGDDRDVGARKLAQDTAKAVTYVDDQYAYPTWAALVDAAYSHLQGYRLTGRPNRQVFKRTATPHPGYLE